MGIGASLQKKLDLPRLIGGHHEGRGAGWGSGVGGDICEIARSAEKSGAGPGEARIVEAGEGERPGGAWKGRQRFGQSANGPGGGGHGKELVMAVGETGLKVGRADGGRRMESGLDVPGAIGGLMVEKPLNAAGGIYVIWTPCLCGKQGVEGLGGGVGVWFL